MPSKPRRVRLLVGCRSSRQTERRPGPMPVRTRAWSMATSESTAHETSAAASNSRCPTATRLSFTTLTDSGSSYMKGILRPLGFYDVTYDTSPTVDDFKGYDVIAADWGASAPTQTALIRQAWAMGYDILTVGVRADQTILPELIATSSSFAVSTAIQYAQTGLDNPLVAGWTGTEASSSATTGVTPLTLAS